MPFSVMTPTLQEQDRLIWRGFMPQDIPDVHKLFETSNQIDNNDYAMTEADLEREYHDPWSNPLTDARIIRTVAGKLAGFLRVYVNPKPEHENLAFVDCEIAPEARDAGLEQECLEWLEDRATERLAEAATDPAASPLPRLIRTGFPETMPERIAFYKANGYDHVRSFYKMERDLADPIPENPLPAGLHYVLYSPELDEKLLAAFNESFSDHWGHQQITPEEWHPFFIDTSDMRLDLSLIVMQGDEIVAFSMNRVKQTENARLGVKRGWISVLGTRRAWRRKGIASALLAESMRRFQAERLDWAGLGVDAESLTGALALYERIGFEPYKTRLVLEKRLS